MSSPSSPALQRLNRLDRSSPDFHDQLHTVLREEEYARHEQHLEDDTSVWLVDYLDTVRCHVVLPHSLLKPTQALDRLDPSSPASRKCLRELRTICGTRVILPTSYSLPSHLLEINPQPFTSGGSCDVHQGTLRNSKVCVKRIRIYTEDVLQRAVKVHL